MQRSLVRKLVSARWGTILRGFYEYNILRHFRVLPPRQLQINVTYGCNARCTMCNIWQMLEREELDVPGFARLLDDPLFHGIERLTLAGGEPSLRRDLPELTQLLMDKMPKLASLTLITNGLAVERILADARSMLALCTERGIRLNISVSLDGVGEIHDEMRGVPGAFDRVEHCLMDLKELQASTQVPFWLGASCVITRKNLCHLRELQRWCEERHIDLDFQLVGFHETYVANVEQRGDLDFGPADRDYLLAFLEELASDRSPSNFLAYYWNDMLAMYRDGHTRQTPCPFAVDSFVLDAYGDMYYCLSERKIGNCLDRMEEDRSLTQPCSAIYYDRDSLAFRDELTRTACQRCNSGCFVNVGIKKDLKKYLLFLASPPSRQGRETDG
jgi:MoaA/NifB/PqqE/SkfB family radical SAM enzyme